MCVSCRNSTGCVHAAVISAGLPKAAMHHRDPEKTPHSACCVNLSAFRIARLARLELGIADIYSISSSALSCIARGTERQMLPERGVVFPCDRAAITAVKVGRANERENRASAALPPAPGLSG